MNAVTTNQGRRWWRVRWQLAVAPLVVYLLVVLAVMFFEEALIFFPTRHPDGEWTPAGLTVEDAWFETADGVRLHGWYAPHPAPRAVILFAHGNAGNLSYRVQPLRRLHRLGATVLIFDYRGYGQSAVRPPNETGILADARAARRWLAERAGVPEGQIVLLGESLGGGVMVDLAAKDGARGLILEKTFTSLPDAGAWHYPLLPVRVIMRNRLDSLSKIGAYHGPLLACHGDQDEIIPYDLGVRLFEAANEPKRFVRLERQGHNDSLPPEWYDAMSEFLEGLPKEGGGSRVEGGGRSGGI